MIWKFDHFQSIIWYAQLCCFIVINHHRLQLGLTNNWFNGWMSTYEKMKQKQHLMPRIGMETIKDSVYRLIRWIIESLHILFWYLLCLTLDHHLLTDCVWNEKVLLWFQVSWGPSHLHLILCVEFDSNLLVALIIRG